MKKQTKRMFTLLKPLIFLAFRYYPLQFQEEISLESSSTAIKFTKNFIVIEVVKFNHAYEYCYMVI